MSSEKPEIPNSLNEHWMPFSSNTDFKENTRLITDATGVYLIKTGGNGNLQWEKIFSNYKWESGYSIQQTTDGGYIICGSEGGPGNIDVYLIKTDGNGQEQWTKTFGGIDEERGHSVQQTTDGGYIVTG